ncbi:ABC transporter permease [Chitinophaga oryzae]|uniref:ABC transporter permease n=1 Tax=Chitinophaga oryzae TaxID=2725414 RepID=A0ABX6LCL2_9BACT|nr:ABC transporter permease [Chitinophaga oryzae]QJB37696.1 ABC transporter permease [Chitinophaga oryzae]
MIQAIVKVMIREWKRIVTFPVYYIAMLALPPVLCLLYAGIYNKHFAEDLPVAIWDEANSPLSRQFTFMLEQTESIHITQQVQSEGELQAMLHNGTVMGAVHFPRRMDEHIKSRQPVYITIYTNVSYLVPAKLLYKDAAQVLLTAAAGVQLQKLMKTGMPAGKAMALVMPVQLQSFTLYNPRYDYQQYLVPGVIAVAMQMMMIMVVALALNYEHKTGSLGTLYEASNGSASNAVIGKALAYLGVAWLDYIIITLIIYPLFASGAQLFSWALFTIFTLLMLACISVGMMVSAIFKDLLLACDVGIFYTSPAFVFSGFTFPRWGMPWYDQYYAMIMPLTPFVDAFFKVYFMDLPLRYVRPEMAHMLLFTVVGLPVAILLFQRTLQPSTVQHA